MKFPFVSREQMALIDRLMVEDAGIGVARMMELAALDIAVVAARMCSRGKIVVLCGKGNNGGDGIAAARHLQNWGFECTLIFPFDTAELQGVPAEQLKIAGKMGIPALELAKHREKAMAEIGAAGLVIDALIGYNLNGNPRNGFAELIELCNSAFGKVLAVDIPSGLDAETGRMLRPCVKADASIALTLPKKGKKFFLSPTQQTTIMP